MTIYKNIHTYIKPQMKFVGKVFIHDDSCYSLIYD